jgi:hypothetical protein
MCNGACKGDGALVEALYDEIERLKGEAGEAGGADRITAMVDTMRSLGIVYLKDGDFELELGPEPVSEVDSAPELGPEQVRSSAVGGIPPRNSPLFWSTPHYSTSAPKEGE